MTDQERLDWLEKQCYGKKIVASRSRVNGLFRLSAVAGYCKGVHSVRAAIDRAVEKDQRKELGFKR